MIVFGLPFSALMLVLSTRGTVATLIFVVFGMGKGMTVLVRGILVAELLGTGRLLTAQSPRLGGITRVYLPREEAFLAPRPNEF